MSKYVIVFEGEIIDECDTLKEADETIAEKIHDIFDINDIQIENNTNTYTYYHEAKKAYEDVDSEAYVKKGIKKSLKRFNQQQFEYPSKFSGKGIVIPAGGKKLYQNAYVSVKLLGSMHWPSSADAVHTVTPQPAPT